MSYKKRVVQIDVNLVGCSAGQIDIDCTPLSGNEINGIVKNNVKYFYESVFNYECSESELEVDCSYESGKLWIDTINGESGRTNIIHFDTGHIYVRWLGFE